MRGMEKFFNTAGPQIATDHYTLDPMQRVHWAEIHHLIDQKRYFLLHAPRQTGKTTTLLAIVEQLNAEGRYTTLYVNIEAAQTARNQVAIGHYTIAHAIARTVRLTLRDDSLLHWLEAQTHHEESHGLILNLLEQWSLHHPKPIVLLLDEVDALIGDTLVSLLRQLRTGYPQRPLAFPHSAPINPRARSTHQRYGPRCRARLATPAKVKQKGCAAACSGVLFFVEGDDHHCGRSVPLTAALDDSAYRQTALPAPLLSPLARLR
ncbi:ATP-binding protein [Ectothiorhodospiraceae bacterium BW-2]|nr:ATP-binding protein [Ectothiorhodospiraceae bacterium BW-2]